MIAALAENRVIGNKGKLPWHIPEDIKRFKELTKGHVVIMGRKTFESIGRPLANRVNIIITRDVNFKPPGASISHSLQEAIDNSQSVIRNSQLPNEIFIIGGGQIYEQAIKFADKLYLTIVKGNFEGDTFFPDYTDFKKATYKKESGDKKYRYTFVNLVK